MRSICSLRALAPALLLGLASCAAPAHAPPPPAVNETPPQTKDPGAVQDSPPLQPAPPPEPEGRGGHGGHRGSGGGSEPAAPGLPDGAPCLTALDCTSGICEGQGCTDDRRGRCISRSRACTADAIQYCGCDGQTFTSSGSCPGRRFAARGACK